MPKTKEDKSTPLSQFIEKKKGDVTIQDFVEELKIPRSTVANILRGRYPQVDTLKPLLRAMIEKKIASPVEVLSILLEIDCDEIERLDEISEVDFAEMDLISQFDDDLSKKKIEILAKELNSNTQKVEMLLQSIPEIISLAIEKFLAKQQKRFNLHAILAGLWPRWAGENVRDTYSSACYKPLEIAGGVNLILARKNLENNCYKIDIALVPRAGKYLKENIQLSLESEGERKTVRSHSKMDILKEIEMEIDGDDEGTFDIIIENDNLTYRERFRY